MSKKRSSKNLGYASKKMMRVKNFFGGKNIFRGVKEFLRGVKKWVMREKKGHQKFCLYIHPKWRWWHPKRGQFEQFLENPGSGFKTLTVQPFLSLSFCPFNLPRPNDIPCIFRASNFPIPSQNVLAGAPSQDLLVHLNIRSLITFSLFTGFHNQIFY